MAMNAADPHYYSFSEALLPTGCREADGHHRDEGAGARTHPLDMDAAPLEQQQHSWEGMVLAPTPGTPRTREAMHYTLSRSSGWLPPLSY